MDSNKQGKYRAHCLQTTSSDGASLTQSIDKRLFFPQVNDEFVILVVVVDDIKFASNSPSLLSSVERELFANFDIKLFGTYKTFIGWEIRQLPNGIMGNIVYLVAMPYGALYHPSLILVLPILGTNFCIQLTILPTAPLSALSSTSQFAPGLTPASP